jgi:hypothetical protein
MFEPPIENRRYPHCLTVLSASEQKLFGSSWSSDSKLSGLPTVRSVVNAVIKQVYELDDKTVTHEKGHVLHADHWIHYRGPEKILLGEPFPAHALISVDSIETADDVTDYMNKVFALDRGKYPKKEGWQAIAAHSSASLPLDKNHPFFRYKECGTLDSRCCRFLVVNEMAVEGMNNKFLIIWGAAELFKSQRRGVQRIGRLGRSAAVREGRTLMVPPASHDRIYVITHEAFESGPNVRGLRSSTAGTISDSVEFIVDMQQATADIMTLQEYVELDVNESVTGGIDRAPHFKHWEKYTIAANIGLSMQQGRRPQLTRLVRLFGGNNQFRKLYVRAFCESAINHCVTKRPVVIDGQACEREVDAIADLKYRVLRSLPPDPVSVLEAERMALRVLDFTSASIWLDRFDWGPFVMGQRDDLNEAEWLKAVNRMFLSWEGQFDKHQLDVRQTPAARLQSLADEIIKYLALPSAGAVRVRELVLQGSRHYLPSIVVSSVVDFDEGGIYCRPEITHALRSENFVEQLRSWVCFVLLTEEYLNDLWAVLRFSRFWEDDISS